MSETLDRVLTIPATSLRTHAPAFCDLGGSVRLAPITPFIRIGDGPHCVGDGHAMWEEAARLNLLDVAGAVRRIVPSGVSRGGGASTPAPG